MIVTVQPEYACRACTDGVTQAPAPPALIEGGLPTGDTSAHVLVSKYADNPPLFRQRRMLARSGVTIDRSTLADPHPVGQGVTIDRSTLADWVGVAGFHLRPVVGRLAGHLKAFGKLFMESAARRH